MYSVKPGLVIGFRGCDKAAGAGHTDGRHQPLVSIRASIGGYARLSAVKRHIPALHYLAAQFLMMNLRIVSLTAFLFLSASVSAQKNWQLSRPGKDKVGAGTDLALELLKGRTFTPVTVAVIDIGTDIAHEELKDLLWTNAKEIPGNGKDDDGNGYIDDVHGWNFIGGAKEDLMYEADEETRTYQKYLKKYGKADSASLSGEEQKEYIHFRDLQKKYLKAQAEREKDAKSMETVYRMNKKLFWRFVFWCFAGKDAGKQIRQGRDISVAMAKYNKLDADSLRAAIIGDDPSNPREHYYGNNHVTGPEASHGTHTAGIIGAARNNNKGLRGITNNVNLMVIRTIPWADERDKDVANAIRYAVDNGAKVINMSFGKYESPDKAVVDEAMEYAASKDVLLVHSAGNESKNTDSTDCFPNPRLLTGRTLTNWIEVGATDRRGRVAGFSNFGKKTVDLFAPGVNIYSSLPGDKYGRESGTSMAGPVVAGAAAIIRAYFPDLTAVQVKEVLMQTATKTVQLVPVPGKKDQKASLSDLSVSGGIVNAGAAVGLLLKEGK